MKTLQISQAVEWNDLINNITCIRYNRIFENTVINLEKKTQKKRILPQGATL